MTSTPRSAASSRRGRPADPQPLILVVEDDAQMRRFLVSALAARGFRSLQVGTSAGGRPRTAGAQPDLIVADASDPAIDGAEMVAGLRAWTPAPIVAVLDPSAEDAPSALLEAGANDYLIKPFGAGDLMARVRVWLKQTARLERSRSPAEPPAARLRIDRDRRCLSVDGRELHITPLEFRVLDALARSGAAGMSEEQLLGEVWGAPTPSVLYLRAHVRQLRQKIERDPLRPRHLLSEARGYRRRYRLVIG